MVLVSTSLLVSSVPWLSLKEVLSPQSNTTKAVRYYMF